MSPNSKRLSELLIADEAVFTILLEEIRERRDTAYEAFTQLARGAVLHGVSDPALTVKAQVSYGQYLALNALHDELTGLIH